MCFFLVACFAFLAIFNDSKGNVIQTEKHMVENVTVSTETELRQAIAQAGSTPTIIELVRDIELISNFIIPSGANITLKSVGATMFRLISTRDMDVITVQENANLTIEYIGITRTPGTRGRGIVT